MNIKTESVFISDPIVNEDLTDVQRIMNIQVKYSLEEIQDLKNYNPSLSYNDWCDKITNNINEYLKTKCQVSKMYDDNIKYHINFDTSYKSGIGYIKINEE